MSRHQPTPERSGPASKKHSSRVVIEYGDKPYVVKQGEREIARFARVDEAEQFAAQQRPAPEPPTSYVANPEEGDLDTWKPLAAAGGSQP